MKVFYSIFRFFFPNQILNVRKGWNPFGFTESNPSPYGDFSGTYNYTYALLDNSYLATLLTSAADDRHTDLQVLRQLTNWLLQKQCHEEKIESRDISVFRKE